jgi:hypothetical protein
MTTTDARPGTGRRIISQPASLNELVGAHPDALEHIYRQGKVADPAELGDAPRGRFLALAQDAGVFMITRSIFAALGGDWMPWKGKEFDHGGNSGTNLVFGRRMARFRTEIAASEVDHQPTFALVYGDEAFKNPWPIRAIRDELRSIGDGLALGLAFIEWRRRRVPWSWFGLERAGG